MKKLVIAFVAFFLAGCNSTQVLVKDRLVVVDIPSKLYEGCEVVKKYPDWRTLTDPVVSQAIIDHYQNEVGCYNVVQAIRRHQANAKKRLGQD